MTLTLAAHTVSDAAGSNATTATVTRNTDTTNALQVTITNSDPNDVTVPQTVTIPAGATSVTFPVGTINNHVVEGTQTATLTASATGEVSGSDTLTVTDTNVPTLTVVLNSHTVNETDPNPATYGTVTRNTPTTTALTVSLLSNEINKLTVPATVTIPAGATSATFPVTVVNDQQIDGNKTATITASASGFLTGSDSAVVVDDNIPTLSLTLADHDRQRGRRRRRDDGHRLDRQPREPADHDHPHQQRHDGRDGSHIRRDRCRAGIRQFPDRGRR